jgi:GntR family transcriptional regulator/MocR family aminotransferase
MRNAMAFHVSLIGRKNLSREICRQIAAAISDGRLKPGDRLSPTRELARALAVSRMTVTVAYEQLAGEGFVRSQQGAGTFVTEAAARPSGRTAKRRSGGVVQPRAIWDSLLEPVVLAPSLRYDFRTGLPDVSLFPHRAWHRAVSRALGSSETTMGIYEDAAGHRALRVAIARQIGFSRGVEAAADDIIITNGTQQALDLLSRVLLAPGDTIAVEDPSYGPPRLLFNSLGLRVEAVPVDQHGLVVEALPKNARAVYVTPSHQYPLSVTMTLPRRRALLAWAERNNAAVIEDDYDSEFRFDGRPCESLHALDPDGRVIYVGSFSKTLLPTLRVGFLVAPKSLFPALRKAKFVTDWHSSTLTQAAIARFMENGDFARHIRRMTRVYRERRSLLSEIIARDFGDHLELVPSTVGLHLTALARTMTTDEFAGVNRRAAERGVGIHVFMRRTAGASKRAVVTLGYGAVRTERIEEGLRLLRSCFERKAR